MQHGQTLQPPCPRLFLLGIPPRPPPTSPQGILKIGTKQSIEVHEANLYDLHKLGAL
jgi:hypothetical protein